MKWPQDPKHKNLIITVLVFLVLLLLSALVIVSTIQLADVQTKLNHQIALTSEFQKKLDESYKQESIVPIKGETGAMGPQGPRGENAISTHTQTTVIKEVPIKGDKGEKGDPGPAGQDHFLIPVMDFATCILGFMREGDDFPRNLVKIPNCEAL